MLRRVSSLQLFEIFENVFHLSLPPQFSPVSSPALPNHVTALNQGGWRQTVLSLRHMRAADRIFSDCSVIHWETWRLSNTLAHLKLLLFFFFFFKLKIDFLNVRKHQHHARVKNSLVLFKKSKAPRKVMTFKKKPLISLGYSAITEEKKNMLHFSH